MSYAQDCLSDAIREAKSINILIEQNKLKFKQLKDSLEDETLSKFIPPQVLEQRRQEDQAVVYEAALVTKMLSKQRKSIQQSTQPVYLGDGYKQLEQRALDKAVSEQNRKGGPVSKLKRSNSTSGQELAPKSILQDEY